MANLSDLNASASPQATPPDPSPHSSTSKVKNDQESYTEIVRSLCNQVGSMGVELSQFVTQNIAKEISQGANFIAANTLESLAGNQNSIGSFTNDLKKATPLIGASTRYAQAWRKYHSGKDTDNELLMKEAKVQVLVAFVEAGIDVGLLGAAKVVTTSRMIGRALAWLTTLRATVPIDSIRMGIIEKAVESILTNTKADQLVETFLKSVVPTPKKKKEQT